MAPKKNGKKRVTRKKGPRRSFGMGSFKVMSTKAPVVKGWSFTGNGSIKYQSAPYEQNYGDGLRLSLRVKGPAIVSGGTGTFTTGHGDVCPFANISNSATEGFPAQCGGFIVPSYYMYDRTANMPSEVSMFGLTDDGKSWTYNLMGNVARCFNVMAFRKVRVHYVPSVSTNTTGTLGLGAEFDVNANFLTVDQISNLRKNLATPLWKSATLDVVNDRDLMKPAARLYCTDKYGNNSDGQQFRIAGYLTPSVAAGQTRQTYGVLYYEVVLDLYGLCNNLVNASYGTTALSKNVKNLDYGSTSSSSSSSTGSKLSDSYEKYVVVKQEDYKECKTGFPLTRS